MHMRHPSNPGNVTATDKLAFQNVWKDAGWELVEKNGDGEWVVIGKKKRKASSSGSSASETNQSETNSED